jgi:hypothetical protein
VQETEVTAGVKVQEIEQLKVLRTYFQWSWSKKGKNKDQT